MRYLVLISILAWVFLACGAYWLKNELQDAKESLAQYRANNEVLIGRLKKEHENTVEVSREKEQLEQAVNNDASGFDWTFNIANTAPIVRLKRLHKNRGAVH